MPIGRPVANTRLYILDEKLWAVPVGTIGELFVGGVGVGRGYIGQPARTAETFIPDPFNGECGARLYRTGDLARFLQDGTIEFLGRKDNQVKVRGYRIELGEIEAVLAEHPSIAGAVVVLHESPSGGARLVAYLVTEGGAPLDADSVRRSLKEKLPDYMIPSALVGLTSLPLTANGKVDRRALPSPLSLSALQSPDWVEPRTPAEELLLAIWRSVLGTAQLGVADNFFEVGGDSLLAIQLVAENRKAFQVEFPLRLLFENPSVELLASCIEGAPAAGENSVGEVFTVV